MKEATYLRRITEPPHTVLNEEKETLLNSLCALVAKRRKKEALHSAICSVMEESAAYTNGPFYDLLAFILMTSAVFDLQELSHLEERIGKVESELKEYSI